MAAMSAGLALALSGTTSSTAQMSMFRVASLDTSVMGSMPASFRSASIATSHLCHCPPMVRHSNSRPLSTPPLYFSRQLLLS